MKPAPPRPPRQPGLFADQAAPFAGWWRPLIPHRGRWERVCVGQTHGETFDRLLAELARTGRKNGEAMVLPGGRTPWENRR